MAFLHLCTTHAPSSPPPTRLPYRPSSKHPLHWTLASPLISACLLAVLFSLPYYTVLSLPCPSSNFSQFCTIAHVVPSTWSSLPSTCLFEWLLLTLPSSLILMLRESTLGSQFSEAAFHLLLAFYYMILYMSAYLPIFSTRQEALRW